MDDQQVIKSNAIKRWVHNLNESGLRQALYQLLMYPETREFIEKQVHEWKSMYSFTEQKENHVLRLRRCIT